MTPLSTLLEEPALGHAELKEAAINGGGNAQQADAHGGLGLNWGAGGGGPQHQGTVGKQKCREKGAEGQGLNSTAMPLFKARRRNLGRKRKREKSFIVEQIMCKMVEN